MQEMTRGLGRKDRHREICNASYGRGTSHLWAVQVHATGAWAGADFAPDKAAGAEIPDPVRYDAGSPPRCARAHAPGTRWVSASTGERTLFGSLGSRATPEGLTVRACWTRCDLHSRERASSIFRSALACPCWFGQSDWHDSAGDGEDEGDSLLQPLRTVCRCTSGLSTRGHPSSPQRLL